MLYWKPQANILQIRIQWNTLLILEHFVKWLGWYKLVLLERGIIENYSALVFYTFSVKKWKCYKTLQWDSSSNCLRHCVHVCMKVYAKIKPLVILHLQPWKMFFSSLEVLNGLSANGNANGTPTALAVV